MHTDWRPNPGLGKAIAIVSAMLLSLAGGLIQAQDSSTQFDPTSLWFRAYTLLQEGLKNEEEGKGLDALAKYNESKRLFDGLYREFPEFHPSLVEYRRTQLVQKIGGLKNEMRNASQANSMNRLAADQAPQLDRGPGNVPSVQPISPEFPLAGGQDLDGNPSLPEWNSPTAQASPGSPARPTVVRPPANPNSVAGDLGAPSNQAPYWNSPETNPIAANGGDANPFQRIQQDFDRMRNQINQLEARNRQLESDLAQRQSELFDAQQLVAESKQRTSDLQRRLRAAEQRSAENPDAQSEVAQLKEILTEALDELEKTDQEKKELLAQLRSTQSDLERIKDERDSLEKERNNLVAIMEGGGESAAIAQLMAENRELQTKLKKVEESARSLREDNSDKTVEIALLKEQIDQIKSEREKLVDDNHRYEGHILELRERLKEMGQEVSDEEMAQIAATSPEAAAENELLRAVVLKQLRRQSQVKQTKALLLRELDKLGAQAENLYAMVEDIANGPALSEKEREMFKTPEMVELVEAAGGERIDGIILVEGIESDGSGTGIVETQNLDDELLQTQKAARLDYSEGRFEEAEAAYRKYLSFRPKSVMCLCNLALVKMATGEHDEASDLLEKAVAIKSDFGLAYYLMGRNQYAQGNYDEALEKLNESIHYDPRNARAHNCVGVISSQKGFVHRAEGAFNEAVKIDPEFGDAHFNLAVLYSTMDKPDPVRAETHYERAVNLGIPRDSSIEHYLEAARLPTASVSMR